MSTFRRSLAHVLNANVIALASNAALIFGLPFFISASDYGYWQLYQLYALLLGYVTFGITDGIYVRYAGRNWRRLPHARVGSQFWVLLLGLTVLTALPLAWIWMARPEVTPQQVVLTVALLSNLAFVPRTLITIAFQATNRMAPYGQITIVERALVFILTYAAVFLGVRDFATLILLDLAAKTCALLLATVQGRDLFSSGFPSKRGWILETRLSFTAGAPVLVANLSLVALPSIARLLIERGWSVEFFGAISIGFNLSNMLLVLVNAVAITLFPRFKQIATKELPDFHQALEQVVSSGLVASLVFSFPLTAIAFILLPDYRQGVLYIPLLLVIFVFDSSMRLLGANWLKALRMERKLFAINIWTVAIGGLLIIIATYAMQSVSAILLALIVTVAIRSSWAEATVRSQLGATRFPSNGAMMAVTSIIFMMSTLLPTWWGLLSYATYLALFFTLRRRILKTSMVTVGNALRSSN
ncbi:hypothetical protein [Micrococcus terreus]|uniref:hypothetical protein n=1 Tax=Micrococcus terreus TaxID=574650 RepID=UPI0025512E5B|nr:hypothetical protein [Micrococcus terreus]MDK7702450.1 hypothetical protein [Micrococcus terreus]WOO96341.1 hypothetical protein R3I42_07090 [Micrococcus terreus]